MLSENGRETGTRFSQNLHCFTTPKKPPDHRKNIKRHEQGILPLRCNLILCFLAIEAK